MSCIFRCQVVVCVDDVVGVTCFFFFKQKTAYEMRISDWSSDVCSSDLADGCRDFSLRDVPPVAQSPPYRHGHARTRRQRGDPRRRAEPPDRRRAGLRDRKSVVEGKSVPVRVDLGGRRIIKKKKTIKTEQTQLPEKTSITVNSQNK